MPAIVHLQVTAVKDHVFIETARRMVTYKPNPGLEGTGRPEGQMPVDEQVSGVTLRIDQSIEIDMRDDQLSAIRAALAAGDVEVTGLPPVAVAPAKPVEAARK